MCICILHDKILFSPSFAEILWTPSEKSVHLKSNFDISNGFELSYSTILVDSNQFLIISDQFRRKLHILRLRLAQLFSSIEATLRLK